MVLRAGCKIFADRKFVADCTVVDHITGKPPQFPINKQKLDIPANIVLADPYFFQAGNVDILLGADLYFSLKLPGLISLGTDRPMI